MPGADGSGRSWASTSEALRALHYCGRRMRRPASWCTSTRSEALRALLHCGRRMCRPAPDRPRTSSEKRSSLRGQCNPVSCLDDIVQMRFALGQRGELTALFWLCTGSLCYHIVLMGSSPSEFPPLPLWMRRRFRRDSRNHSCQWLAR